MSIFGREPAVILEFAKALLVALSVTVLPVDAGTQAALLALLVAVFGALKGLATRPIAPTILTDLIQAVAVLLLSFGVDVGPERVAALMTLVSAAVVMTQRAQVSPAPGLART